MKTPSFPVARAASAPLYRLDRQPRRAGLGLLLAVVLLSCKAQSNDIIGLDLAPDASDAQLTILSGDGQEGVVGQAASDPLAIRVVDEGGDPLEGVSVEWRFLQGMGRAPEHASAATQVTTTSDSLGLAEVTWTFGTTAGPQQATAELWVTSASPDQASGTPGTVSASVPGKNKGKKVGFQAQAKPSSPDSVDMLPDSLEAPEGASLMLSARVVDRYGNLVDDAGIQWRSANAAVATVDDTGMMTTVAAGSTEITAKTGPVEGVASVTVTSASAASLVIAPTTAAIGVGETLNPTVATLDSNGDEIPITGTVVWGAADPPVATVDQSGLITGASVGSTTISAAVDGVSGTMSLEVTANSPVLAAVIVAPNSATLAPGDMASFSARGQLSDGSATSISVSWSATGGTIDSAGSYSAGQTDGLYDVVATEPNSGLADTAQVTITQPPTLASISVSPGTASVDRGGSVQFSATGTMSDGSSTSVTVNWTAGGGTITSGGLYTAGQTDGLYDVVATEPNSGLADTAQVTITQPPTLASISVSPGTASVDRGGSVQFSVTGTMSDGSSTLVSVNWTAGGGAITSGGLYTAGQTDGLYDVVATEPNSGLADTAQVTITPPPAPGTIPQEFSLSRPLLQNNPGALLGGDDWQSYATDSDVANEFHHEGGWGTTPVQCGTVDLVTDGVFGQVPQAQHNDGSSSCKPGEVRYSHSLASANRAWIRVTHRVEANYQSNTFWKFIWSGTDGGTPVRHLALTSAGGFTVDFERFGGSESTLPGAPSSSSPEYMGNANSMISDQEWWEYIIFQERVSSSHYRVRMWARPLSSNNGQTLSASVPGSPSDYVRKLGLQSTGASVPADFINRIWLGMTRNDPTSSGHTNYFRWGPWEAIDADVIADPYGLAGDMVN